MKKGPWKFKKLLITLCIVGLILLVSAFTNPSKEDYIRFDEAVTGYTVPDNAKIAEADLFFFSVYATTPKFAVDDYGIIHLGFMGHFFQVNEGQFDETIWEEFLE